MKNLPKSTLVWLTLAVSLLINLYFLSQKFIPRSNLTSSGKVVNIVDGDTFDLESAKRVRLKGIDAPEYPKGCLSETAKQRLAELILGQEVRLEEIETDKFDRLLAFVFRDNLFLNEVMAQEGLATVQKNQEGKYASRLTTAEITAQEAKRGIWSAACQTPTNPNCLIKGNVRRENGTKIYHLPQCYNYEKIVMDSSEGDQWFCQEEEAQAAGFTKSADCPQ
jgi:endonuclease YncB( thermonuclease family)